jgi:hypothetical protein
MKCFFQKAKKEADKKAAEEAEAILQQKAKELADFLAAEEETKVSNG